MTATAPTATALIADDEPLLREELTRLLRATWPELRVVAEARNGREAVELFEAHTPQVCFLDVQMPGLSGVEAAARIGRRAQLVFVTAYDQYALQAFERGALDYLLKPVEPARLADTVTRVQERLLAGQLQADTEVLLRDLIARLAQRAEPLRWLRANSGPVVRLINVDDVDYLRSDEKYTVVAWRDDAGRPTEAVIRTSLKELTEQLDPTAFAQVHRSVVVRLAAIERVKRGENETAEIHLKHRPETLPVSRSYLGLFRHM